MTILACAYLLIQKHLYLFFKFRQVVYHYAPENIC